MTRHADATTATAMARLESVSHGMGLFVSPSSIAIPVATPK